MIQNNIQKEHEERLARFKKFVSAISTSDNGYNRDYNDRVLDETIKQYTYAEAVNIVEHSSIAEKIQLSRDIFKTNGFYQELVLYYSKLLLNTGILIPSAKSGIKADNKSFINKYNEALNFIEKMKLPTLLDNISIKCVRDGAYYGVILEKSKDKFVVLDLPTLFCQSNFKDPSGKPIIDFDLNYFDKITNEVNRKEALAAYPPIFKQAYAAYKQVGGSRKKKKAKRYLRVPSEISICFLNSEKIPMFLSTIPTVIQYDDSLALELERDREEITKVLVQKIPHLSDGNLLFEPDEAEEFHRGAVQMMKPNKNMSILTTYADVEINSSQNNGNNKNYGNMDKMIDNVYLTAGVSKLLFASDTSMSLEASIKKDIAVMMILANKYADFISDTVNSICGTTTFSFRYKILPISYQNHSKFIEDSLKLATLGYSQIIPALSMGISQKDLVDIKTLENDILDLGSLLKPLESAYNSSNKEVGAPKKEPLDKNPKTEDIDNNK